jgi:hypothetical protein
MKPQNAEGAKAAGLDFDQSIVNDVADETTRVQMRMLARRQTGWKRNRKSPKRE